MMMSVVFDIIIITSEIRICVALEWLIIVKINFPGIIVKTNLLRKIAKINFSLIRVKIICE